MELGKITPLNQEQIEQIIPHRRPFRFIDQIIDVEFGKYAVGMLSDLTSPEYDWLKSHFPTNQLIPGAIIIEALAEVGAVAVLGLPDNKNKIAMLARVRMRFRRKIKPGDIVRLETEITSLRSNFGRGLGRVLLNGSNLAADGLIDFSIVDKPLS